MAKPRQSRSLRLDRKRLSKVRYSRISLLRIRVLLTRALDGRMDAVQELMESDPVNAVLERTEDRLGLRRDLQLLASDAADYWASQIKLANTRHAPIIAAYAHYLRWMAWTLHPIEEDDL